MLVIKYGLFAVGVLIAIVGVTAVVTWAEKKYPGKEYDERQQMVHGRAYRLAFVSSVLYFVPVTIWQMLLAEAEKTYMEMYLILFLGVWIQLLLFNTYCIFHGAGLPLSEKCSWAIGTCVLFAGYYFLKFFGYRTELDRIGLQLIPLLMGVACSYLALLYTIQFLRDRKE